MKGGKNRGREKEEKRKRRRHRRRKSWKRNCKHENDCGVTDAHTELRIFVSNSKYHKNHVLTNT